MSIKTYHRNNGLFNDRNKYYVVSQCSIKTALLQNKLIYKYKIKEKKSGPPLACGPLDICQSSQPVVTPLGQDDTGVTEKYKAMNNTLLLLLLLISKSTNC